MKLNIRNKSPVRRIFQEGGLMWGNPQFDLFPSNSDINPYVPITPHHPRVVRGRRKVRQTGLSSIVPPCSPVHLFDEGLQIHVCDVNHCLVTGLALVGDYTPGPIRMVGSEWIKGRPVPTYEESPPLSAVSGAWLLALYEIVTPLYFARKLMKAVCVIGRS